MHTIFDSCPEGNGIRAMAITRDAKYLATISDAEIQVQGPLGQSQLAGQSDRSVAVSSSAQAVWHLRFSGWRVVTSLWSGVHCALLSSRKLLDYHERCRLFQQPSETFSFFPVCCHLQRVCIWRWTLAVETPACTLDLPKEYGFQVSSV